VAGQYPDHSRRVGLVGSEPGRQPRTRQGGEALADQKRKRAKTSNILPIIDHNGNSVAMTDIVAGNHNDAFDLSNFRPPSKL